MPALTDEPQAPALTAPLDQQPSFRLRFGAFVAWVGVLGFFLLELWLWVRLARPNLPPRFGIRRVLLVLLYTPQLAFYAFALAAMVGVLTDLVFRAVVRPLMVRWYNPRSGDRLGDPPLEFHLAYGEQVVDLHPARWIDGRAARPGRLVQTDRRLIFIPRAWDREPWSISLDRPALVRRFTPRRRVLGFVEGYPDHLVFAPADGPPRTVVVPDPSQVLARLRAPESAGAGTRPA